MKHRALFYSANWLLWTGLIVGKTIKVLPNESVLEQRCQFLPGCLWARTRMGAGSHLSPLSHRWGNPCLSPTHPPWGESPGETRPWDPCGPCGGS